MAPAPTTTKISSGSSFITVATLTSRVACTTPPTLTRAMPPMTPTMASMRAGARYSCGSSSTITTARAEPTPPQARMLPNQASVPATNPASGPKAAAM